MENANFGRILFRILLSVLKAIDNLTFMSRTSINRRKFLSKSAMSLFGYSLMVSVPASPDAKGGTAAISDVGRRIDKALSSPQFSADSENYMAGNILNCDVLVAGGGMAGICAAIAAARNGAKVVLVQDRSRLGGNASSEIKMHPLGVDSQKYGFREGGILEEILLENAVRNPQNSWEIWDLLLYDKCISEPNIALILDTFVYRAETEAGNIKCVYARSDKTLNIYKITADVYIDCTGDCRMAMEAGAELMSGREGVSKYGEDEVVPTYPLGGHLCSSIMFTTRDFGKPMPFKAPSWAKKITARDLKFRDPRSCGFDYGYWFISHGGLSDTVRDNEVIRFELLSTVLGVWDYIKNSGKYPEADNRAIDTIGMIPGKRDSYRIKGIKVFKQFDIRGEWKNQPDSVGAVGWKLEDQPSGGFYDTKTPPAMPHRETPPFNIPLSILISKDFSNLMMAGRNISASHLAFSCLRVMKSCAVAGQAAGTAAAIAADKNIQPPDILKSPGMISLLQQTLLRDAQPILNLSNSDSADLARSATASASVCSNSTSAKNVLSGVFIDKPGSNENKWQAPIADKPWIKIEWKDARKISNVILNLDTGSRFLTISLETKFAQTIMRAPQPETLCDYNIVGILPDGSEKTLVEMRRNHLKLVSHKFEPVELKALRVDCLATCGSDMASIFEIRAYA